MRTTTNGSQGSVKLCAYNDRLRIPTANLSSPYLKKSGRSKKLAPIFSPFLKRKGVCGDHGGKDESRGWTWC